MIMRAYKRRCEAQSNRPLVSFYGCAFAVTKHNNKQQDLITATQNSEDILCTLTAVQKEFLKSRPTNSLRLLVG